MQSGALHNCSAAMVGRSVICHYAKLNSCPRKSDASSFGEVSPNRILLSVFTEAINQQILNIRLALQTEN